MKLTKTQQIFTCLEDISLSMFNSVFKDTSLVFKNRILSIRMPFSIPDTMVPATVQRGGRHGAAASVTPSVYGWERLSLVFHEEKWVVHGLFMVVLILKVPRSKCLPHCESFLSLARPF